MNFGNTSVKSRQSIDGSNKKLKGSLKPRGENSSLKQQICSKWQQHPLPL